MHSGIANLEALTTQLKESFNEDTPVKEQTMVQTKDPKQIKASVLNSLKKLDPNKLKMVV